MNLRRGAQTPLASRIVTGCFLFSVGLVLTLTSLSCGGGSSSSHATHNVYISLTAADSVALFRITDSSGALSSASNSVPQVGTGPVGLALLASGKFLYAANSTGDSVSTFNIAGDGTLTQAGNPTGAGLNPQGATIDPSGKFLLVANTSFGSDAGSISIFSIDAGTGALTGMTPYSSPSLFHPTQILMTSSGFAYVLTPSTNNAINAFTFSGGTLTPISTYSAGNGTSAIAIDPGAHYLYAANTSDNDVKAFTIDPVSGALTPLPGTYSQPPGTAPEALAVDTTGKFLYVSTRGSSSSLWVFSILAGGALDPNITGSPFSLPGGNTFLLMEPRGKYFYIGDSGDQRVAAYSYDATTGKPAAISGSPFSIGHSFGQMLIVP